MVAFPEREGLLRNFILVISILLLAGCSSKYRVDAIQAPTAKLQRSSSFYVVQPKDGTYGGKNYAGSGAMTANAAVGALSKYVTKVDVGTRPEALEEALATAKQKGFTHLFEPIILNWEDRATEWSGRPDRITVKYTVYDVATGAAVSNTVTRASSKWGTFGGDHPQDLLPVPVQRYVDTLF